MSSKTRSPAKKAGPSKSTVKPEPIELSDSSEDDAPRVATSKAKNGISSNKSTPKPTSKASAPASNGKRKVVLESESDSEDAKPAKKRASLGGASKPITAARKRASKVVDSEDDDEGDYKNNDLVEEEDEEEEADSSEEEDVKPAKKKASPAKKPTPAKKAPASKPASKASSSKATSRKTKLEDDDETVEAKPKPKWVPKGPSAPLNPGSKEIPDGAPDALGGLTFVFTGELESLGREEAITLAKRYGGRVTTAVSSKTSYVVLGADAGPKKLEMIKKNKIKTLTEDEFLDLIATRGSDDLDDKYLKKQKEEEKKIKETAKAMTTDIPDSANALWTVKYAPKTIKDLCGNPGIITKLTEWLEAWPKNAKYNFAKPGKDGSGMFRAALLSGPPGIGKTTTAHLVAKACGYKVIELNASDTRNKKLLEQMLKSTLDNTVLDGFLSGKPKEGPLDLSDRSCLIMDEVDGTSAGDRGGIGALNALIKKTKVPIICIANDRSLQKMKPLQATTLDLRFRRPDANSIRSRLMSIAFKEGIKIDKTVADQLVNGTQSDIRQIINILSTWKLSSNTLSFDETKKLTDARDSNSLATPFALMDKLFGPYAWSSTSQAKISEMLEVYFQEFDLLPLFVQENYLKHKYARANSDPRRAAWKKMQLTSQAADSISDGDMVDRMIHGSQQQWSLMPVHGLLSTVLPAYYTYGTGSFGSWNGGGENARAFPGWFGKNSTQGRLQRSLTDIQIHMRLKVSGDKREIRQSYIPALSNKLVQPLVDHGTDGVTEVIKEMDEYYLSKDEWDAIVEMGIGENTGDALLKKIPTQTKSAFTRKYNSSDHPIPFHKATDIAQSKKMPAAEKPDFEEAFEIEAEADPEEEEKKPKKGDDENTIKDKLVKAKKPKAAPAAKDKAAAGGKAAAAKSASTKAAPKSKSTKK